MSLRDEIAIRWVGGHHPELHAYVREMVTTYTSARSRPPWGGSMVAYGILAPDARPVASGRGYRVYERRFWWLAPHDPYEGGGGPTEAVISVSVRPGRPSVLLSPPALPSAGGADPPKSREKGPK